MGNSHIRPYNTQDLSKWAMPPATTYTEALGRIICQRVADGESIRHISTDLKIPISTVFTWSERAETEGLRVNGASFATALSRAQQLRLKAYREDIQAIAQDDSKDIVRLKVTGADGKEREEVRVSHAAVNRSKLQCDNLRWLLERLDRELMPRTAQELSGPNGQPLQVNHATPQLQRLEPDQWLQLAQQQRLAPALPEPAANAESNAEPIEIVVEEDSGDGNAL